MRELNGDRQGPALVSGRSVIDHAELREMVARTSRDLRVLGALEGCGPVARVGLHCPNGAEHVLLALAILHAGGCVVPIPGELALPEREALVAVVGVDTIIDAGGAAWSGDLESRTLELQCGSRARLIRPKPESRWPPYDEDAFAALDPAFIRFSSGTTGRSKGIVLSHRAIAERIAAVNQGLRIGPGDRIVWFLPMAHHFVASILLFLEKGATIVLSRSHLARDVLDAAAEHHATVLYGTPYHYALLAAETCDGSLGSLRMAVSTTASLPPETASAFEHRFGLPLTQAYGLIEMGLPVMNLARAEEKPAAVGRPLPGYEVRLRDEHDRAVGGREVGEVLLRGPGMLDAYLAPWQRRDALAPDGWFATGDLGWLDEEGDLRLVGRTRSVISVAGLKCFPEEIEAALLSHPSVRAARVIPEPHPRLGSVPVAEVVPLDRESPPTTSQLSSHCRARLARYKVPIEFRVVDAVDETASGKVKRA